MTLAPGTRLGPYEIRSVSPVPGLGEVYDARDHEQGRDVSLTVVRTDFARDPDRLERFQRDATAAARLDHPRILTVHNVGADAQAAYIISEPIQGRTLREVRAGGPIPPGAGAQFVPQIAEALTAAHEKGVVHGDLKPDHILFTADGVKVIGFGLAAATGHSQATASGDLAAFDAISETLTGPPRAKSRGPRVEAASGRGWSGVAAAAGVIGFAVLIGIWLFGGDDTPATEEPEAVASEPVITEPSEPPSRPPSPGGSGAAAPTTPEVAVAPTTEPASIAPQPVAPVVVAPEPKPPAVAVEPRPAPSRPSRVRPVRSPSRLTDLSAEAAAKAEAPAKAEAARRRRPAPTSAASGPTRTTVPPPPPAGPSRLVWLDRTGAETGALGDAADYGHLALSPDGTRIAVSIREPGGDAGDIWIIDAASGTRTRLTSDPADDIAPVWSPDGGHIAFASIREGSYNIYETASDGTGGDRALIAAPGDQVAYDWTPGSGFLMYQTDRPGMATGDHMDLWARRIPGGRAFAFLRSVHRAGFPSSSPDARWYTFVLMERGSEAKDVYVARFPTYDGRRRVSAGGGSWPRWRADAIFYVDAENRLVAVPVTFERTRALVGTATRVSARVVRQGRGSPYDVSSDGQRILINTAPEDAETLSRRAP